MPRFTFDITLSTTVTVDAADDVAARKMIVAELDCSSANLGAWPNGDPILAEVSVDQSMPIVLAFVDGHDPQE